MRYSIRDDSDFGAAVACADEYFRQGFAAMLNAALQNRPDIADLNERVKSKMREKPLTGAPGNAGAIRDFRAGAGWIQTPYMEALFEVLEIPNATEFARAYDALHKAVDGLTETSYRRRNGSRSRNDG